MSPPGHVGLDELLSSVSFRSDLLVDDDTRLSSAEVEHRVAATAGWLRRAGVERGDRVAWQSSNRAEVVVLYRACWRLGAVAAPIHHQAGPAEVEALLQRLTPRLIVSADEVATAAPEASPIKAGEGGSGPDDVAVVLFTSGSTGRPKGVLHTQAALAYKARLMGPVHGLTGGDATLVPAPLAHVSGLLNGVLVPGAMAMKTVLMGRWDPDHALALIEHERVSFMVGPPTFFLGLLGARSFTPGAVASLRLVSTGGAGITPAFVRGAAEQLDCVVKRTYGSTEAPTVATSTSDDPPERAATSDGRAVGDVGLRVGGTGELLVRGPELFAGYLDPEDDDAAFEDGWFRTGDLATIDTDGWLTITGRLKDVVIRGGENIAVAEVEALLECHPSVRQAVVVGEADERLGERVAAFVVATAPFDLQECQRWFADQGVARFKTPERIEVVDAIPALPAGKPDRAALRNLLR